MVAPTKPHAEVPHQWNGTLPGSCALCICSKHFLSQPDTIMVHQCLKFPGYHAQIYHDSDQCTLETNSHSTQDQTMADGCIQNNNPENWGTYMINLGSWNCLADEYIYINNCLKHMLLYHFRLINNLSTDSVHILNKSLPGSSQGYIMS